MREQRKAKTNAQRRKSTAAVKACRKRLKNEFYAGKAAEINSAAECRQVEREFSLARQYGMLKKIIENLHK